MAVRRRPVSTSKDEASEGSSTPRVSRSGSVNRGWGSPASSSSTTEAKREGVRAPYLAVSKEKQIFHFLEDAPSVRFSRHYVGGRYQNCPESLGVLDGTDLKCPLCENGHVPNPAYMINVINVSDSSETDARKWSTRTFTFGKEVHDQLLSFLEEEKYQPIDQEKWYWHVYQVGGGNERKSTKLMPLKARDIEDDYGIIPLSEGELDECANTLYDEKSIFTPYVSVLAKLAATLN